MIKRLAALENLTQADFIAMQAPHALLLIDVDNTLLSPYEAKIRPSTMTWITAMAKDHEILLSTNNFTRRQSGVGTDLNIPILMRSFKPMPWRVRTYLKKHGAELESVIVIGDQVITDIFLALWLKRPYILIKPMDTDKHVVTRWLRILESAVIKDE